MINLDLTMNARRRVIRQVLYGVSAWTLPVFGLPLRATDVLNLPQGSIGRVLRLPVGISRVNRSARTPRPIVWFGEKRAVITEQDGYWWAWVALPLSLKPGTHQLKVGVAKGQEEIVSFVASAMSYPEQRLTIVNSRQVNPNPDDLERIAQEKKITNALYQVWNEAEPTLPFRSPFPDQHAPISSLFGLKRFFNNQPRSPHSGLDFAVARGTPIRPIADGEVVNTGDYFFNGNSVFVHHGQGVMSFYCHLEQINTQAGAMVDGNSILGTVGATGRVTAPHLHLGVYFSGVAVDPEPLIAK